MEWWFFWSGASPQATGAPARHDFAAAPANADLAIQIFGVESKLDIVTVQESGHATNVDLRHSSTPPTASDV